jgi:hypothetical protein
MTKEIPQKGWYIHKEKGAPTVSGTTVYLDGKQIGGIQKASVELDAERNFPILKLELLPVQGLEVDLGFGDVTEEYKPFAPQETTVFRSATSPEEVLKGLTEKESKAPETEVL